MPRESSAVKPKPAAVKKAKPVPIAIPQPVPVETGVPQWARDLANRYFERVESDAAFKHNMVDFTRIQWDCSLSGRFLFRDNGRRYMTVDDEEIAIWRLDDKGEVTGQPHKYVWPKLTKAQLARKVQPVQVH